MRRQMFVCLGGGVWVDAGRVVAVVRTDAGSLVHLAGAAPVAVTEAPGEVLARMEYVWGVASE